MHALKRLSRFRSSSVFLFIFIILIFNIFKIGYAKEAVVNVYNWGGYIAPEILTQFEKQTGIHVNYTTYDNNEVLYTKLKIDPHGGYDVVVPSTYLVERMIRENMLHSLDHRLLPNLKNINPNLLNREFDPANRYSVPYLWGTDSIAFNDEYYTLSEVNRWHSLWETKYRNQLLMLDDVRSSFAAAFRVLGDSINTTDPHEIYKAYLKLLLLLPNIKLFAYNNLSQIYCDGDALIGMAENGDIELAHQCNPHIQIAYPQDGVNLWMDNLVIPKYAPHLVNAQRFINFIMQPDVALKISEATGYSTPNQAAVKLMPRSLQNDIILNPPEKIIRIGSFESYIDDKTYQLLLIYWERLKLSA